MIWYLKIVVLLTCISELLYIIFGKNIDNNCKLIMGKKYKEEKGTIISEILVNFVIMCIPIFNLVYLVHLFILSFFKENSKVINKLKYLYNRGN